jgi:UDP-N-acetylmuramoylalanine--D-glutamate ligase
LGGSSKGADFSNLARKITESKIESAFLIGEEKDKIDASLREAGYAGRITKSAGNFEEIIKEIIKIAKPGEVVLLSPACASFGLFKNYKDRGEKFKEALASFKQ